MNTTSKKKWFSKTLCLSLFLSLFAYSIHSQSDIKFELDGRYNTGIGNFTFLILERGRMNTAVGKSAMAFTFSGSYNTAVGAQSLLNNCAGNNNVALGGEAGKSTLGSRNVF